MATHSYIAAALTKYDGLTAALFPGGTLAPAYFGKAPAVAAGAQRRTPYVVLTDLGSSPAYQSDAGGPEEGGFALDVYADTLADVDRIAAAVKWNGARPDARAGFDQGSLALDAPLYHLLLTRTKEVRAYEGDGVTAQRVHRCTLTYRVQTAIDPTAAPA